jgi:hypothetical protein
MFPFKTKFRIIKGPFKTGFTVLLTATFKGTEYEEIAIEFLLIHCLRFEFSFFSWMGMRLYSLSQKVWFSPWAPDGRYEDTCSARCRIRRIYLIRADNVLYRRCNRSWPYKGEGTRRKLGNLNLRELLSARVEHMELNGAAQIEETATQLGGRLRNSTSRQRSKPVFQQLRCRVVSWCQLFYNALQWFVCLLRWHERLTKLLILFLCS